MLVLGKDVSTSELISIDAEARSRGLYVIGSTGTGKTTVLQSIAYQDMKAGHGVCVLDPHGDMIDWLLERVPADRVKDVILFDPADLEYPIGINLLECDRDNPKQVRWVISNFVSAFSRMFDYSWGPRLEHVLSHTLWTAMKIKGSTILELLLLLSSDTFRENNTTDLEEPLLANFWKEFPKTSPTKQFELVGSTVNKLTPFLLDHQMRNIVGQSKSSFDMRELMDDQKILLVNLAKGELGENNSALLGSFIINMILIATLSRRNQHPEERKKLPFHVIVDEYQNFASDSFSVLQSEARKYAVDLVVAHQFREQLSEENKGSALNVGNFISFRTTGIDGIELSSQFDNTPPDPDLNWEPIRTPSEQWEGYYERGVVDQPVPGPQRMYSDVRLETANDLSNLVPFRAKAKVIQMDDELGRPNLGEFTIDTLNPDEEEYAERYYGLPNPDNFKIIRNQTRQDYAKLRAEVDAQITARTSGAADNNIDALSKDIATSENI